MAAPNDAIRAALRPANHIADNCASMRPIRPNRLAWQFQGGEQGRRLDCNEMLLGPLLPGSHRSNLAAGQRLADALWRRQAAASRPRSGLLGANRPRVAQQLRRRQQHQQDQERLGALIGHCACRRAANANFCARNLIQELDSQPLSAFVLPSLLPKFYPHFITTLEPT